MSSPDTKRPPENRKPKAWVEYDPPGAENNYVFVTEITGRDDDGFISGEIADVVEQELGSEWRVTHRGNKIEIVNGRHYGLRDDSKINAAFRKALGEEFEFLPVK